MTENEKLSRARALLNGRDGAKEAELLATQCIDSGVAKPEAYAILARALLAQRQGDAAVKWCKKGLELDPTYPELVKTLRDARLLVLDALVDDDEDDGYEEEAPHLRYNTSTAIIASFGPSTSTSETTTGTTTINQKMAGELTFDEKVERVLRHLDVNKLVRISLRYVLLELLQLRVVTAGFSALFCGILVQALLHRQKLMVISMLLVGLAHSKLRIAGEKYLQTWVDSSIDKLGAVTWLPRLIVMLPIILKIVGHLRFMLFLKTDMVLSLCVATTTGLCVFVASCIRDQVHPLKTWGYGKRLKFVAYVTAITYVVFVQREYASVLKLLGPALIDAGGILLASVTSQDMQRVARRAWKRLFNDISADVQQDVEFDAWFFLGLTNWIIDYWQQPTDFSVDVLIKWLSEAFSSFEKSAVHLFRPELHNLKNQMSGLGHKEELKLLVEYLKRSLHRVPPRQWLGFTGLVAKQCSSFVVAALLLVFHGTIALPLLPFMASELGDARALWALYQSEEMKPMDGLDVLLLGSPLARVWQNTKTAVYHLEGAVVVSQAVATGVQVATAATRLVQLARFAARVKAAGLVAHADELPAVVASAFAVLGDATAISNGVQHVYQSVHLHDLGDAARRWWRG